MGTKYRKNLKVAKNKLKLNNKKVAKKENRNNNNKKKSKCPQKKNNGTLTTHNTLPSKMTQVVRKKSLN